MAEQKIERTLGFNTRALHAGYSPDPTTHARAVPIYQSTSFVFQNSAHAANLFALQEFGNIYTRIMNPTTDALEQRVASLENGAAALAMSSGQAAQFIALSSLLEQGDHLVSAGTLYGGTYTQFDVSFRKFGYDVSFVEPDDPENFRKAIRPNTKCLYGETVSNPRGNVLDIESVAKIAHEHNLPLVIDNTFATPYLCRPIDYGADIVVHSLTKFMGGHGNSIGGAIVDCGSFDWLTAGHRYATLVDPNPSYNGIRLAETFGNFAFAIAARVMGLRDLGPAIAPLNAFLILTGIETLPLRMARHCENALAVAKMLKAHPRVAWVNYAGLADDPSHYLVAKICPQGAGSVFTFGLKGGYEAGVKLVSNVKLFSHLANIGDTRSLIIHPASTTHRQLTSEQRRAAGAADDVVRLSVGIEEVADIIADLEQALAG